MRRAGIAVLAGLVAAIVAAPGTAHADTCVGAGDPLTANSAQSERTLLCLTNIHRANNGAGPLAMDPILQTTARQYSEHLRSENSFNHFGGFNYARSEPCDDGAAARRDTGSEYPWDRAQANGFPSNQVGENIARGFMPTPQDAFEGFRDSPDHNENMLDPDWVVAGMGISGGPYVTEMFSSANTAATDTAIDLLITDECIAARNDVNAKQAAVDAAQKKFDKAKKKGKKKKKRKAKKALKAAQQALAAAHAGAQAQCTATSY